MIDEEGITESIEDLRRRSSNLSSNLVRNENDIQKIRSDMDAWNGAMDGLTKFLRQMQEEFAGDVQDLRNRITDLENRGRPRPPADDALTLEILSLLQSAPHMRLNALSVSESLGAENKKVYSRLLRLSRQGRIVRHQNEGRQGSFQCLQESDDDGEKQAP